MLGKVNERMKKIFKYLRIRKKLGGGFRKKADIILNEYGLTQVLHKKSGMAGVILEESEFVLIPFKARYRTFTSYDKSCIIVSTGQKVYQKYKGEDTVKELEELENMSLVHSFAGIAKLFEANDNYREHKLLNLKTGEITNINGEQQRFSPLNFGIQLINNEGYSYMYLYNEEIITSKIFKDPFIFLFYNNRYGISRVSEEEGWKLYEFDQGIIEREGPWDSVETIYKNIPATHFLIKGNKVQLLDLKSEVYKLYSLPGKTIEYIGKIDDISYYQVKGDNMVYLCKFQMGELVVLSEYEGNEIVFSKPVLDVKKGEFRLDILVVTNETTKKAGT